MLHTRFEELPVWKEALQLAAGTYALTAQPPFHGEYSLRDQIERAAVSVSNHIAEGFESGTTKELLTFLHIARSSAGKVRSMLCLLEILPDYDYLKPDISDLKSQTEDISRQLQDWADSLQDSPAPVNAA
jgi:four helix bundle protein